MPNFFANIFLNNNSLANFFVEAPVPPHSLIHGR